MGKKQSNWLYEGREKHSRFFIKFRTGFDPGGWQMTTNQQANIWNKKAFYQSAEGFHGFSVYRINIHILT